MTIGNRVPLILSLLVVLLRATGAVASADDTICNGAIGAQTVDNLVVPDGARCLLLGTQVEGNIFVETGS